MIKLLSSQPSPVARTVIIGAAGFVGQACVTALSAASVKVLSLSRSEVDLLATNAVENLARYLAPDDRLVIAAAIAPVKNPAMLIENVRMMQAICAAIKQRPVAHIVYVSSDAVYQDSAKLLSESSCAEPASLHGAMHLTREIMLRTELPKVPLICVRSTLIYGANDPHNGYGPNRFLRQAKNGEAIVLFGDGEELRDHIAVEDVAEIITRCVLHYATGTVNAVTGEVISFRKIAEIAIRSTDRGSRIVSTPRTSPMPHNGYRGFDASLLKETFPQLRQIPFQVRIQPMITA